MGTYRNVIGPPGDVALSGRARAKTRQDSNELTIHIPYAHSSCPTLISYLLLLPTLEQTAHILDDLLLERVDVLLHLRLHKPNILDHLLLHRDEVLHRLLLEPLLHRLQAGRDAVLDKDEIGLELVGANASVGLHGGQNFIEGYSPTRTISNVRFEIFSSFDF